MREPGYRVPVTRINGRKGPDDISAGYPAGDMMISRNIDAIVVIQKLVISRLQIYHCGDDHQHRADKDQRTHLTALSLGIHFALCYLTTNNVNTSSGSLLKAKGSIPQALQ